ncbi:hypothetical protein J2D73_19630 [Acetobacter sacchari]|uniref:Uncharacterized protein n=1 Tax=Acetobacter sacchari TaxID=2661687 RepID=A0ABS3M1N3_9PROT|nr:hypothetical protein [Acetobacter sacchari]MBO1361996.1 hypothetical protein [Acetobacter sacchari]
MKERSPFITGSVKEIRHRPNRENRKEQSGAVDLAKNRAQIERDIAQHFMDAGVHSTAAFIRARDIFDEVRDWVRAQDEMHRKEMGHV